MVDGQPQSFRPELEVNLKTMVTVRPAEALIFNLLVGENVRKVGASNIGPWRCSSTSCLRRAGMRGHFSQG